MIYYGKVRAICTYANRTFSDNVDIIKRIDPSDPNQLEQTTIYLMLKDEKEKELYSEAISIIQNVINDPRCPFDKLVVFYKTKENLNRLGEKSLNALFMENNIMVRLFNHYIDYDFKYSFGKLPLDNLDRILVEFLKFISVSADENALCLKISMWNITYNQELFKKILEFLVPFGEMHRLNDNDILKEWNCTNENENYRSGSLMTSLSFLDSTYESDIRLLPINIYGKVTKEDADIEDVFIKPIPGSHRQRIDYEVRCKNESFQFHLSSKTENFIYMCILLSKYNSFEFKRAYLQHHKTKDYFKKNGRRCTGWMNQLFNKIISGKGDFSECYKKLARGPYDYHTLNNTITKINKGINNSITNPFVRDKCIIQSKGAVGDVTYYVKLLSENIELKCNEKDVISKPKATTEAWNMYLSEIASIKVEDEKKLPEDMNPWEINDLTI